MGRKYLEHIGGRRLFNCAQCDTFLTNRSELISTRFTGATGRAFLFNKVVNLNYRSVQSGLGLLDYYVDKLLHLKWIYSTSFLILTYPTKIKMSLLLLYTVLGYMYF